MLKKVSFKNRLFIYYSLFIIGILLLLSIVFYSYISSVLQEQEAKGMEQTVNRISSSLDSFIREMNTTSTQVLFSKDIQNIMSDAAALNDGENLFISNLDLYKQATQVLVSINSPRTIVNRIGIFNLQGSFMSIGNVGEDSQAFKENLKRAAWFGDIDDTYHSVVLPPHPDDWIPNNDSSIVVSFVRELIDSLSSNTLLGYIEIQQPYSILEDLCRVDELSGMEVVVLDDNGKVVYPYDKLSDEKVSDYYSIIAQSPSSTSSQIFSRPWDGKKELVLAVYSPSTHWTTMLTIPKDAFMNPVYFIQKIFVISGVILFALTLLIMHLITKSLTAPIREMRMLVRKLSPENLSIVLSGQTGNNEVALLSEVLTKSLNRLKESMEQNIQARAGEAYAHMLALQAQMNPHFLYNTLMAISGAAGEVGNVKVTEMCNQLSEMLRYIASFKDDQVTIGDEVQHVSNYLKLTAGRYEHFLQYDITIDDGLLNMKVPKLILQPIVENCFAHGFKNSTPPFKVEIKGMQINNGWKVTVTDNGSGFDEKDKLGILEQMNRFKNGLQTGNNFKGLEIGGMALANIYMRLYLLYGEALVFGIDNNPNGGAEVTIGGRIAE